MPKKLKPESDAEQSERFRHEAQRLIDAGELNPIEADENLDTVLRVGTKSRLTPQSSAKE